MRQSVVRLSRVATAALEGTVPPVARPVSSCYAGAVNGQAARPLARRTAFSQVSRHTRTVLPASMMRLPASRAYTHGGGGSHSQWGPGAHRESGAKRAGRTLGSGLKMAVVYLMTATGLIVWAVQLGELGIFYYFPQKYEEIMAHELEEERRRDKFYAIDASLSDDDYFKELGAKDDALGRLTHRLQTQSDLPTLLSPSAGPVPSAASVQITYLNSLSPHVPKGSNAHLNRDIEWRPRFYLELCGVPGARSAIGAHGCKEHAPAHAHAQARVCTHSRVRAHTGIYTCKHTERARYHDEL